MRSGTVKREQKHGKKKIGARPTQAAPVRRRASNMLSPARRFAVRVWACALLGCLATARAITPSPALRGAAFLGCIYRAHATLGVDKEIVDSALVFDGGAVASGLSDNNDAVQCLRAAIAEVLTKGTDPVAGEMTPWVSTVVSTAYTDSEGEQDSKVTFSISMSGIDAQTVLDDLTNAAVDTTNLMAQLNSCAWPFDAIDAEETGKILPTQTFQRAAVAQVGAVVSSALVFDGFGARTFNADSVAVLRFKDVVAAILSASPLQIDNVVADEYSANPSAMVRFDVAVHAWPIGAEILETKEAVAGELKKALVDGQVDAALTLYAVGCDCVLEVGVLNDEATDKAIDDITMDGSHTITSPPVPCTDCGGGDDDDDLGAGARIAIALAAVFCFLGGALASFLYISRRNKFNGCLSPAKRRISGFTGSADLELRPVDPTQKEEVRPARDVV